MAAVPADLRSFRLWLGMTQAEMAGPLSVSVRALQSYEQGWRPVPDQVRERMALLLFLDWRRKHKGAARPCWRVRGCSREERLACPVHEFGAGEICWMLRGVEGGPKRKGCGPAKGRCWENCPVTRPWFKALDRGAARRAVRDANA